MKRCNRCAETKPLDAFAVDRRIRSGRNGICRECCNARQAARYDSAKAVEQSRRYRATPAGKAARRREYVQGREKAIARATAWNRAHPEQRRQITQARRAKASHKGRLRVARRTIADRWAMWGQSCWLCGAPAVETDHVKPVAAGGVDLPCNLRPICRACNVEKGATWPFPTDRRVAA